MEPIKKAANSLLDKAMDFALGPVSIDIGGMRYTKRDGTIYVLPLSSQAMAIAFSPNRKVIPEKCYHCGETYVPVKGKGSCPECGGMVTTANVSEIGLVHDYYQSKEFDGQKALARRAAVKGANEDSELFFVDYRAEAESMEDAALLFS